jgi:murein DD-endopeptidase MepM/ murein hydrolase activator NlpD
LNFENSENLNLKTVSFQDAKKFFNVKIDEGKEEGKLYARRGGKAPLELTPNWNTIDHDELYGIEQAQLTLADVEINRSGDYISKLFFINRNDKMESIIFTIFQEEIDNDGTIIEAKMFFNELNGDFIDGYRIENGKITKKITVEKKPNIQKAAMFMFFQEKEYWTEDCLGGGGSGNGYVTNEIVIFGNPSSSGISTGPTSHGIGGFPNFTNINVYYPGNSNNTNNYSSGGGPGGRTNVTGVAGSLYTHASNERERHDGVKCKDNEYLERGECVKKPCMGDPVKNPEIVSSGASGKKGGTFGCTRKQSDKTCGAVRGDKNHDGLDIHAPVNQNAFAMYSGTISSIRNTFSPGEYEEGSYGNYIVITTVINGITYNIKYNHLNTVSVIQFQTINVGDVIGLTGNTGNANPPTSTVTPHIHLQVFNSNWSQRLNPEDFLKTKFDSNHNTISNNCQ